MTARELAMTMIQDVLKTTGITATAGIGTKLKKKLLSKGKTHAEGRHQQIIHIYQCMTELLSLHLLLHLPDTMQL